MLDSSSTSPAAPDPKTSACSNGSRGIVQWRFSKYSVNDKLRKSSVNDKLCKSSINDKLWKSPVNDKVQLISYIYEFLFSVSYVYDSITLFNITVIKQHNNYIVVRAVSSTATVSTLTLNLLANGKQFGGSAGHWLSSKKN